MPTALPTASRIGGTSVQRSPTGLQSMALTSRRHSPIKEQQPGANNDAAFWSLTNLRLGANCQLNNSNKAMSLHLKRTDQLPPSKKAYGAVFALSSATRSPVKRLGRSGGT